MRNTLCILFLLFSVTAHAANLNNTGQILQINTSLSSFVGKPSWLLVIRDIDHNQNIPYLYPINKADNTWLALTYGRNYLITASELQFPTYQAKYNQYDSPKIKDFCQLESRGRIMKNVSMQIRITGDLSPYSKNYRCEIMTLKDAN